MVEKLRYRITLISLAAIGIVLAIMCISLSVILRINLNNSADRTLYYISENIDSFLNNRLPDDDTFDDYNTRNLFSGVFGFGSLITEDSVMESRFFTVFFNEGGQIYQSDISHISEISAEKAEQMAARVYRERGDRGSYQHYRFLKMEKANGDSYITFLNCTSLLRPVYFAQYMCISISLFIMGAMTLIVWLFSKKVANPFLETLETQKQFITNAGHEIKTPLSIIDANAEVLKLTQGENEWIDSIQNQTKRLSKLVQRLMTLAKAEEMGLEKIGFEKFSISDAVIETAGAFSTPAAGKGLTLVCDVAPDVFYKGDETAIRQLVEILLDNAVKYCSEGGSITVSLKSKLKSVSLEVSNSFADGDKKSLDKLFERFYRADNSRSRKTGGYGIGLSIAKAITEKHKGKITASIPQPDIITFTVLL